MLKGYIRPNLCYWRKEVGVPTECRETMVKIALDKDLPHIKVLADAHRRELGFVNRATLESAINSKEILKLPYGFLHFHHRRDKISTLYHLCVGSAHRRQGVGRSLVSAWEEHSRERGIKLLRLKCPLDLEANGFYARLGFSRVDIEPGKHRPLVIWEKKLREPTPSRPKFVAALSAGGPDLKRLFDLWDEGGDPRNPFERVLTSPLACPLSTNIYLRSQQDRGRIQQVWFDCGAYQVQQGKRKYEDLLLFLERFYCENQWADGYILPDLVPLSTDSDAIVEYKVRETLYHCSRFFDQMPAYIQERAIAPVHGRTPDQIDRCLETYARMGITRVGFGSWGTSGPNNSINMLSQTSLAIFSTVLNLASEQGMKVHCFGIGGPNSYKRLRNNQLIPHTLDSTTWWKAGGFGSIFFPNTSQIQITQRRSIETTKMGLEQLKVRTNHSCYFCQNIKKLREVRNYRIAHNLAAWIDTLDR
ncbi:MAG: GNAT family N-acetyltransferase [Cyanobacteriota bacterium]|nr:GNAT family N-acetyltransferase [Cyanobacteriota bacterium]